MSDESMKEFDMLDAADQAMVHALQINPRASWAQIGKALRARPGDAVASMDPSGRPRCSVDRV